MRKTVGIGEWTLGYIGRSSSTQGSTVDLSGDPGHLPVITLVSNLPAKAQVHTFSISTPF